MKSPPEAVIYCGLEVGYSLAPGDAGITVGELAGSYPPSDPDVEIVYVTIVDRDVFESECALRGVGADLDPKTVATEWLHDIEYTIIEHGTETL